MNKIKKWLDIRFLKFMVVGVVNTVVGTAVMFVMYNVFHQSYWISSASNYVVGSILSYFLNKYFTFESKKKSLSQVLKFVLNISLLPGCIWHCKTCSYMDAAGTAGGASGQSCNGCRNGAFYAFELYWAKSVCI